MLITFTSYKLYNIRLSVLGAHNGFIIYNITYVKYYILPSIMYFKCYQTE